MTQQLGTYLTTSLQSQNDGLQRCSTNAMTARRAVNMPKQQDHVAMTATTAIDKNCSFSTMLAQTGSTAEVSQNFVQTEPEFSDLSTQTEPERLELSTQTEPALMDLGTNVMSMTQALDSFMDGQEQTGVNGVEGKTNNQMSLDGQQSKLIEPRKGERITAIDERIEKNATMRSSTEGVDSFEAGIGRSLQLKRVRRKLCINVSLTLKFRSNLHLVYCCQFDSQVKHIFNLFRS